jgi:restriction endonuclease Mrr
MLQFNHYRLPILLSLFEQGGEAPTNLVLESVYNKVKDKLTFEDVNRITSREVVWRNRVRWVKTHLTREGLVSSPERGVWKLTKKGNKALKLWS